MQQNEHEPNDEFELMLPELTYEPNERVITQIMNKVKSVLVL